MSQDWTSDCFAAGHVAQTDLQNMENNFLALHSCFSGAVQPAGAVEGQLWRDTAKKVLKQYNGASWFGMFHGDATQKILVYRNDLPDGYALEAVTDKVIALKGGATYVAGGATAGSWTISGLSAANAGGHNHSHFHVMFNGLADSVQDTDGSGTALNTLANSQKDNAKAHVSIGYLGETETNFKCIDPGKTLDTDTYAAVQAAHTHVITQDGTARIAAAVVIMLKLDL